MNRFQFLKKVKKIARKTKQSYREERNHGKGSHWTVCLNDKCTIVPEPKGSDYPSGTLRGMVKDLGIEQYWE